MGLEIKRLNWAGLGVVEVDGRERCVPVTRQGERVEVRWHEAGWGRYIGERLDSTGASSRLDEQLGCAQARRCTGCSLRHLSLEEQRTVQGESHLGALLRLSGRSLDHLPIEWVNGAPRDGYRTRVTSKVWLNTKEPHRWMLSLRPHWGRAVDLALCPNHPQEVRSLVGQVTQWINDESERLGLDERERESGLFSLARVSVQAGGGLPTWIVLHCEDHTHRGSLKASERERRLQLGELWLNDLPLHSLSAHCPEATIYAEAKLQDQEQRSTGLRRLAGPQPPLWHCERGHLFPAQPPAWLPQSPSTLEALRAVVSRCLWGEGASSVEGSVFELGCGVGVLGIALAIEHPQLTWIGVDLEEVSVECAQESAVLNDVSDRVSFRAVDGRRGLAETAIEGSITHMVIHAMRKPLSGLLSLAAHRGIKHLCYLAPSAPALARDLAEGSRYQLDRLYFIDQMPGTAQAMSIAQLTLDVSEELRGP